MFKKKCQSLPQLPLPRRYCKQSDHLHYYPNYHFHIPVHQNQKHLLKNKNVKRSTSQSNPNGDSPFNLTDLHHVHHSSSSNSANWKLNNNNSSSAAQLANKSSLKHHDSDLSIHSSLSNHSNLSSISVNSSNFCNTSSQLNTTSGIPSSYSSSAPGTAHLFNPLSNSNLAHTHALHYPARLDKYRQIQNRSNCTNHSSQINTSDYVGIDLSTSSMRPTPPPLPRYSSYNSISSQPFRSNLTTPIAGSLHLTASQISLEFNTWYNQLQINQEEQQKAVRKSVRDWVRTQPLSILQLDSADREVLKIADGINVELIFQNIEESTKLQCVEDAIKEQFYAFTKHYKVF